VSRWVHNWQNYGTPAPPWKAQALEAKFANQKTAFMKFWLRAPHLSQDLAMYSLVAIWAARRRRSCGTLPAPTMAASVASWRASNAIASAMPACGGSSCMSSDCSTNRHNHML